MIAEPTVYLLCTLTSLACGTLLFKAFVRNQVRLLLWSAICFFGLGLSNFVNFADLVIIPDIDIAKWRSVPALASVVILLYGLIWEVE